MDLEDYLAIPYVLDVHAGPAPSGEWVCEVSYEELEGCVANARSPLDALDELERLRIDLLTRRYARGESIPTPRPPLRSV